MKPEEIMIGDWVSLFQGNPDGSSCNVQVTFIGEYGEVGIEGCEEYTSAQCNLLFPIPLTPEILDKNGFELQRDKSELGTLDTYWLGSGLGAFRIHRLNNGDYQFGLAKIKFVHQLQHAIRLCGISKNIEI